MKSVGYGDENLITSDDIAKKLVDYAVRVSQLGTSSAVTIPVLESNGVVVDHTLVLNAASQIDVVDVDGDHEGNADDRFGTGDFPPIGTRPAVQPDDPELSAALNELGDL